MFERFTDRARRVLVLAQEDARERSHNYLGTEHILMGIVAEREGLAADALHELGVSLDGIRDDVLALMGPAQNPGATAPPFTPRAKRALELSLGEALKLGHNYIGVEHLVLGVAAEGEGIAARVLSNRGVKVDELRRTVADLLAKHPSAKGVARGPAPATAPSLGALTPAADTALRGARARAGQRPIGTHDLITSILYADRSAAVHALRDAGFDLDAMRVALENASTLKTSDQTPEETVAPLVGVRVEGARVVISVDDTTLLSALERSDPAVSLSADNPRVAHDLGTLWQQIHETLGAAIKRLAAEPPPAAGPNEASA